MRGRIEVEVGGGERGVECVEEREWARRGGKGRSRSRSIGMSWGEAGYDSCDETGGVVGNERGRGRGWKWAETEL